MSGRRLEHFADESGDFRDELDRDLFGNAIPAPKLRDGKKAFRLPPAVRFHLLLSMIIGDKSVSALAAEYGVSEQACRALLARNVNDPALRNLGARQIRAYLHYAQGGHTPKFNADRKTSRSGARRTT